MRARPVCRGQHVAAACPAHGEAHRVLHDPALALVVAHDRREDRQPGRVGGRPALGPQRPRLQVERGLVRGLPARVRLLALPELVELPVHRVDHDDVAVAGAVPLEVLERLPGLRQRALVLVDGERPVLDRGVVGHRVRPRVRLVRVVDELHRHPLLVGGHEDEAHVEVVSQGLVGPDGRDDAVRVGVDRHLRDVLVPRVVGRKDLHRLEDAVGLRRPERHGRRDLGHRGADALAGQGEGSRTRGHEECRRRCAAAGRWLDHVVVLQAF